MRPVPERLAAKAAGERFYTDGKPCKNGHYVWMATEGAIRCGARRRTDTGRCTACLGAAVRRWKNRNPGEEARWARERRAKDPTGHRAEVKRWKEKNPEWVKAYMAGWSAANHELKRALHKKWRDENREHVRRYGRDDMRRRRGAKGINGGSYTPADIEAIRERQEGKCAACRCEPEKLQIDHILAVTKGGTNDPSNIQLLCKSCNVSKKNHDFEEWMQLKGYIALT